MSHDCCSPEDKKHKQDKKKGIDSFMATIVGVTLLLLVGVIYFGTKIGATTEVSADSQVSIEIAGSRHDWGTIDINSGLVSKSFAIENTGSSPLKLYDVATSCMCTTAQLITPSQTSKKFGMHEKSTSVIEVQPGETAELVVEFDPLFHGPSGVGPISRTVTLNTNDTNQPTLSFQLAANVVKK